MNTKDNTLRHIALGLYSYRGWYIRELRSLVVFDWVEIGRTASSVMLHKGIDMCAGKAADACKLVDNLIKEMGAEAMLEQYPITPDR